MKILIIILNKMRYTLLLVFLSMFQNYSFGKSNNDTLKCDKFCCIETDVSPSGLMIGALHNKHEFMISYRYMNMNMKGLLSGTSSISSDQVFANYLMSPESMNMHMHMIMAMYGISDRFTVMTMLNYKSTYMQMKMPGGSLHADGSTHTAVTEMQENTSGINDMRLYIQGGIIKNDYHELSIFSGVSIALGNINIKGGANSMFKNKRLPYGMQQSSGTTDVLGGLNYIFKGESISFGTQANVIARTGYNSVGYKLGNALTLDTWGAYKWTSSFSSSIRFEGNLTGSIEGADPLLYSIYEPSANPLNYGGKTINAFLGSSYFIKKSFMKGTRIGAEYGIPFYQNVNGIQMSTNSMFNINAAITF